MQKMPPKQSGFTLIELIIVIVLLAIISKITASILNQGVSAYLTAQNVTDADWQGRVAIENMIRNIRLVRSPNDIITASSSQFSFTDTNGNTLNYQISGSSLLLNSQILADGIQALTLSYFDKNGSATAIPTAISYVTLSINVSQKGSNFNLPTSIYLRNTP